MPIRPSLSWILFSLIKQKLKYLKSSKCICVELLCIALTHKCYNLLAVSMTSLEAIKKRGANSPRSPLYFVLRVFVFVCEWGGGRWRHPPPHNNNLLQQLITTTYQHEHPFSCTNQQNQKPLLITKIFPLFFSSQHFPYKNWIWYVGLLKKKKKKRKILRHSLRSTLNYHYDCLIWTLKKRLVSKLLLPTITRILKGCFFRIKGDDFVVHATHLKQTIEKSIYKDCGEGKVLNKIENSILKIEFSNIFQSNMY